MIPKDHPYGTDREESTVRSYDLSTGQIYVGTVSFYWFDNLAKWFDNKLTYELTLNCKYLSQASWSRDELERGSHQWVFKLRPILPENKQKYNY